MALYIARRLAWTIIVVLVVLLLTFAVFYLLPAGDPALRFAGKSPTRGVPRPRSGSASASTSRGTSSSAASSETSSRGDENGWPGLGYSYVTNQPCSASSRSACRGRCS